MLLLHTLSVINNAFFQIGVFSHLVEHCPSIRFLWQSILPYYGNCLLIAPLQRCFNLSACETALLIRHLVRDDISIPLLPEAGHSMWRTVHDDVLIFPLPDDVLSRA